MDVTKPEVAEQIAAYLRHESTFDQLVDWAEHALMDGNLDEESAANLAAVIARLGVADMRAFGLSWEDCEDLLHQLGYKAHVEITAG